MKLANENISVEKVLFIMQKLIDTVVDNTPIFYPGINLKHSCVLESQI